MDAGCPAASAKVTASRWLKEAAIQAAIANQRATFANPLVNPEHADAGKIATATRRRVVLSAIFEDTDAERRDRIKAADVLNKMDGVYIKTHRHMGPDGEPLVPPSAITFVIQQQPGSENRT